MYLCRGKVLVVVLTLLVFIGQTVAAAVNPCQMFSKSQPASMDMMDGMIADMIDCSVHNMDGDAHSHNTENAMTMDCCSQDSDCHNGVCISLILPSEALVVEAAVTVQKITPPLLVAITSPPALLYRPPLSC